MKPLFESIQHAAANNGQAASIIKHLRAVGIFGWEGLTKTNFYEFRDHLVESVAPNTAKTICASFKAILKRFSDEIELPKDWESILSAKGEKPQKTYLTMKEIEAFAEVEPRGEVERYVKSCFLVSCWTGMRVSDAKEITEENIKDGVLTYVSKKTGREASVPAKPGIMEHIRIIQEREGDMYLATYNDALRRMARRAGLTEPVKIHRAGRTETVQKWEAITSHSGRVSTASCLADAGATLTDIKLCLGHSSEQMSARYVACQKANLSAKAMKFFL